MNPRNLLARLGGLRSCSDAEVFACHHALKDDPAADLSAYSVEAIAEARKLQALFHEMDVADGNYRACGDC